MSERVGRARWPIVIGAVGAIVLMVVAVAVAIIGEAGTEDPPAADASDGASRRPSGTPAVPVSSPTEVAAECAMGHPLEAGADAVLVFFPCGPQAVDHRSVLRGVEVGATPSTRLAVAIDALLAGPSASEVATGLRPAVPDEWNILLDSVELRGGVAVVDFNAEILSLGAPNTSAQMHAITEGLGTTALGVPGVTSVEVHVGESCGAFVVWMGEIVDCVIAGARDADGAFSTWRLESAIVDGEPIPVAESILVGEGRISGYIPCSQFELHLSGEGTQADVVGVDLVDRGCAEPPLDRHVAFLEALPRLTTVVIQDGALVLAAEGVELRFSPATP